MASNGDKILDLLDNGRNLNHLKTKTSKHSWTIRNFSLRRAQIELTAYIFSSKTSFKSIPFSGKQDSYGCDLLLSLESPEPLKDVKIIGDCSFLNAKSSFETIKSFHFYQSSSRTGFNKWIKITDFTKNPSELLPDDTLTFFCDCIIIDLRDNPIVTTSENIKPVTFEVPKSTALVDLEMLLASKKFSDVTIYAGGEEIQAHKTILAARSPVFSAMFDSKMEEAEKNRVEITDIEPNVIRKMLQYIYTDEAPNLEEIASGLFMAADKYDLNRLKVMCAQALSNSLTTDNAADTLILADRHSEKQLKDRAMKLIIQNLEIVIDTPGYKLMADIHPHLINEILRASLITPNRKRQYEP